MKRKKTTIQGNFMVVDYVNESLNSAKGHLLKAESAYKGIENKPFEYWSEMRTTILFSLLVVESQLNKMAREHARDNPDLDKDKLQLLTEENNPVNFKEKLKKYPKIVTGQSFDLSDELGYALLKFKKFRDAIVHFKIDTGINLYRQDITIPREAVEVAKSTIKRIYSGWNKPIPYWVDMPYDPELNPQQGTKKAPEKILKRLKSLWD